jgi:hypothetical protein
MENVTNVIRIKTNSVLKISPDGDFFRVWVDFLKPVHDLTNREMDVLALFLKERYRLQKTITDEATLDSVLMSNEVKKRVREQCGIKFRHLNTILSTFRKRGVLKDEKININFIPTFTKTGAGLFICFDFANEQQRIKLGPQAHIKKA